MLASSQRYALSLAPVLVSIAVLAVWPARAQALVAHWHTDHYDFFTAEGCGATDSVQVRLRAGARRIHPRSPRVGSDLRDDQTGQVVARVTDVTVGRSAGHPSVGFTASGVEDACANPSLYPAGWSTDGLEFRIDYITVERVRLGSCFRAVYKPRNVILACGDGNLQLRGLHWRRWNTRTARGRGYSVENDCIPYCAAGHFHWYPARVIASKPRLQTCDRGRGYIYQRLRVSYTGESPPGRPRAYRWSGRCLTE